MSGTMVYRGWVARPPGIFVKSKDSTFDYKIYFFREFCSVENLAGLKHTEREVLHVSGELLNVTRKNLPTEWRP